MVLLVSLDILSIGVLAFECFLRTFTSLDVHSRRTTFFVFLAVRTLVRSIQFNEAALLASLACQNNYKAEGSQNS
jgi:hypothetical protein